METSSKDSPMDISPTKNSEHFYAQWGSFGATNNEKIETNEEIWNCREGDYFLCIAMEVCHQDLLQYLERLTPDVLRQDKHLLWVAKSLENMADAVDCIHKKCKILIIKKIPLKMISKLRIVHKVSKIKLTKLLREPVCLDTFYSFHQNMKINAYPTN